MDALSLVDDGEGGGVGAEVGEDDVRVGGLGDEAGGDEGVAGGDDLGDAGGAGAGDLLEDLFFAGHGDPVGVGEAVARFERGESVDHGAFPAGVGKVGFAFDEFLDVAGLAGGEVDDLGDGEALWDGDGDLVSAEFLDGGLELASDLLDGEESFLLEVDDAVAEDFELVGVGFGEEQFDAGIADVDGDAAGGEPGGEFAHAGVAGVPGFTTDP